MSIYGCTSGPMTDSVTGALRNVLNSLAPLDLQTQEQVARVLVDRISQSSPVSGRDLPDPARALALVIDFIAVQAELDIQLPKDLRAELRQEGQVIFLVHNNDNFPVGRKDLDLGSADVKGALQWLAEVAGKKDQSPLENATI